MQEPLLTAHQVARLLNIKVVTVYAAAADGRIPSVRLWEGRRRGLVRFRPADIRALLREPTSSPER